jgi:hypothetical protein
MFPLPHAGLFFVQAISENRAIAEIAELRAMLSAGRANFSETIMSPSLLCSLLIWLIHPPIRCSATTEGFQAGWSAPSIDVSLGRTWQVSRSRSVGTRWWFTIDPGRHFWQAIGPFPAGTREHPLLSSPIYAFLRNSEYSSPDHELALDERLFKKGQVVQSPLCKARRCTAASFEMGEDGWTRVSYPSDVR